MEDLGAPVSYLVLEAGAPVYSSDGKRAGKVERVVADTMNDIFEGIVLDTSVLPGAGKFAEAEQVEEIHERGVVLKLDRAAVDSLPAPPD
ncbi:MAG: PRC-barrel domain-containing protein [Solirubrobacterales bacterium]